jgi:hypothetical protein
VATRQSYKFRAAEVLIVLTVLCTCRETRVCSAVDYLKFNNEKRELSLECKHIYKVTKNLKTAGGKDKITQQYIIEQNHFERFNEFTYLGTQINAQIKEVSK